MFDDPDRSFLFPQTLQELHTYFQPGNFFVLLFFTSRRNEQSTWESILGQTEIAMRNYVKFVVVSCDLDEFAERDDIPICKESNLHQLPGLLGLAPPETLYNPYTKKPNPMIELPYDQPDIDYKKLSNFVSKNMPTFFEQIRSLNSEERFLKDSDTINHVMLFSAKKKSPSLFKALASTFRN